MVNTLVNDETLKDPLEAGDELYVNAVGNLNRKGAISGIRLTASQVTDLATSTVTFTNKLLNDFSNSIAADEQHLQVRNESGSTMTIGECVYISGYSVGQALPLVSLADANGASTYPVVGLVEDASILNNATGGVIISGRLAGIDTSAFSAGDVAYLSTTAGGISARPTGATDVVQSLGEILRSHATLGIIEIEGSGAITDNPNLADGDMWVGNATNVATPVTMSGDATISNAGALTIAAKAVDVAMLADGTDGELVTWDSAGVATTVPVGTIGHVLTSGGTGAEPTFQAAAGGTSFIGFTADADLEMNDLDINGLRDLNQTSAVAPVVHLISRTDTLTDNTQIGAINFMAPSGQPAQVKYAQIVGDMVSDVDTAEEGALRFSVTTAGAHPLAAGTEFLTINNAGGGDIDFNVDTNFNSNAVTGMVLDANASGNVITNIDLTADITGTLPIADGGTANTTAQAAIDALSAVSGATNEFVLTKDTGTGNAIWKTSAAGTTLDALTDTDITAAAKGDTLIFDGTSWVDLTVGANDTVLTAASGETTGVKWGTGGAGDMVLASAQTNSGIKTFLDTTMKLRNVANTFDGYFVNTNTADRIYTLPDEAGTISLIARTETLTGKTLTTPTISATGFTNAQHAHTGATSGGQITEASISDLQAYLLNITGEASTSLTDTASIAYLNTANIFIAGNKQTASQSATTSGLNLGAVSAAPSTPAEGDVWYQGSNDALAFRDAAATREVVTLDNTQTLTAKTLTTPTIASLTNAQHDHTNAAGGGQIAASTALSDFANLALVAGDVYTGTHDFGGADDLEIPNGAAPTVDTAGQIAIDTTITSHTGAIKLHDGTEEITVIGVPTAQITTTDGHIIQYDSGTSQFIMAAAGAADNLGNHIATIRVQEDKGIDVASPAGGIMTLGTDGNTFDVTGTNTINEILATGWQAGSQLSLQFDGILTVTHNSGGTNDILLGDQANLTTAAGDVLTLFFNGTDWVEVSRSVVSAGGGGTLIDSVQCWIEAAEGLLATPEIHAMTTTTSNKISGWIMPDTTASTINFKCKVPDALNASPAAKIRVTMSTYTGAVATADVNLQVLTWHIADGEDMDVAATNTETAVDHAVGAANDTLDVYEEALTTQPVAGDLLMGQIIRNPAAANDDFTNALLITNIELIITRDT